MNLPLVPSVGCLNVLGPQGSSPAWQCQPLLLSLEGTGMAAATWRCGRCLSMSKMGRIQVDLQSRLRGRRGRERKGREGQGSSMAPKHCWGQ